MAVGLVLTDPSRWDRRRKADLGRKSLDMALRQNLKMCAFPGLSQRDCLLQR